MRVGAGRVDGLAALSSDVLALGDASFGTIEVSGSGADQSNDPVGQQGDYAPVRLHAGYEPITTVPGVSFQVTVPYVVVPPGGSASVRVQLRISNPAALRKTPDPTVVAGRGPSVPGRGVRPGDVHRRPRRCACPSTRHRSRCHD